uniref:Uncharacterized protein n=1 Tax=Spodoptera exigua multiple nucleopolyhedrovirus TaxID=10454 RepID=A0A6N0C7B7_9ABAC|nr:hypothetical protein [Spodoptera exigua multiple nucleopolyhedrovirus]
MTDNTCRALPRVLCIFSLVFSATALVVDEGRDFL